MNESGLLERARRGAPLDDFTIVDCHVHYDDGTTFHYVRFPERGVDSVRDSLILAMDQADVDMACLSSFVSLRTDYRVGNDRVADAVTAVPDRLVGFVVIDPHYPDLVEKELARFAEVKGMKGIKLHPSGHSYPTDGPNYEPAWEFADEHRLPILIHGDTVAMGNLAARYPNAAFLNAHSGFGYRGAEACIAVAREHPNVYLDLTSTHINLGLIEHIVDHIGPDQVLYGSDIPLYGLRYCVGSILFARISDDDKRKILGQNMQRLLGAVDVG